MADMAEEKIGKPSFFLSPTWILPLASFIFLLAGFLYAKFYYGAFGIQVHHCFNLQDYLLVAMDSYVAYVSVLTYIFLKSIREYAMKLKSSKDSKNNLIKRIWRVITPAPQGWVLAFLLVCFLVLIKELFVFMIFWLIFSALLNLVYLGFVKNIETVIPESVKYVFMSILVILPLLIGGIYFKARADVEALLNKKSHFEKLIAGNEAFEGKTYRIIGANTRYLFLYDINKHETSIKNLANINQIIYKRSENFMDGIYSQACDFFRRWLKPLT